MAPHIPTFAELPQPRRAAPHAGGDNRWVTDRPLLPDLLDVRPDGVDRFVSTLQFEESWPIYGGQVAAQALLAAAATVPGGRRPHSLHGYFLRGGNSATVTSYDVDRDRDGRSFSARRVTARQAGEVIFTAA